MLPNPDGTDWWLNAIQQKGYPTEAAYIQLRYVYEMVVPIVSIILRDRVELMFGVSSQYISQIFTMR